MQSASTLAERSAARSIHRMARPSTGSRSGSDSGSRGESEVWHTVVTVYGLAGAIRDLDGIASSTVVTAGSLGPHGAQLMVRMWVLSSYDVLYDFRFPVRWPPVH